RLISEQHSELAVNDDHSLVELSKDGFHLAEPIWCLYVGVRHGFVNSNSSMLPQSIRLWNSFSYRASFSVCRRFLLLPLANFQIQNEDAVKNGHQEQRDKGGHGNSADLRITERLP